MSVLDTFRLTGKRAVVTGGSRGIGKALAVSLAQAGADVAILARSDTDFDEVVGLLREQGVAGYATCCDVTDRASVEATAGRLAQEFGPVDILVNNAGTCVHAPALEVTDQQWQDVLQTNVTGVWLGSTIFGAGMVERGGGVIVNIGSISANIVNRPQWQPGYNASKAAVHQLTKSLAAEWARHHVRVNAIAPGYIKTEMAPVDDPQYRRQWIEDAPMCRYGMPEELGPTVVYLASEASSFMTGHVLVIDGGYTIF